MKKIVLMLGVWLVSAGFAQSASFDCQKATTRMEKAICADRELSSIDDRLGVKFNSVLGMLSDDGKMELRKNQKRWIKYVRDSCKGSKNGAPLLNCLGHHYSQRLTKLDSSAVPIGPYIFSRIEYFFYESDPDDKDRPFIGHWNYPRIDQPLSAAAMEWNRLMAPKGDPTQEAACDGRPGDESKSFKIIAATKKLVTVELSDWTYCHGTPHGFGATGYDTRILDSELRPLQQSDVFLPDKPWKEFLVSRFMAALIEKTIEVPELDPYDVKVEVASPDNWRFSATELTIAVNSLDLRLPYAVGDIVVKFTWKELGEFLAPNAPIPESASVLSLSPADGTKTTVRQGSVVSRLVAGDFSYLEVEERGSRIWIAGKEIDANVGDHVSFVEDIVMDNYESKLLGRTFERLVFFSSLTIVPPPSSVTLSN